MNQTVELKLLCRVLESTTVYFELRLAATYSNKMTMKSILGASQTTSLTRWPKPGDNRESRMVLAIIRKGSIDSALQPAV